MLQHAWVAGAFLPSTQSNVWEAFDPLELLSFPGSCVNPRGDIVVKTSDSGLCFQNSCEEEIYWVSNCMDTGMRFMDSSVYFWGKACGVWICSMLEWWMECGGVRTDSAEALPSCQMFSLKPKCTARLGSPVPIFSASCICISVGVYLSSWYWRAGIKTLWDND